MTIFDEQLQIFKIRETLVTRALRDYMKLDKTNVTITSVWWSDLVDNNPPSGSIDGNYATSVTVHWVSGISYVNASCTTMTQMTLDYLVPFGIIVG